MGWGVWGLEEVLTRVIRSLNYDAVVRGGVSSLTGRVWHSGEPYIRTSLIHCPECAFPSVIYPCTSFNQIS